jgi:hypothetical protein
MKKHSLRSLGVLGAAALLLAGCGGGGGGGDSSTTSHVQFSEPVAGCSVATQKKFVRAYLDDVYLWYREIPAVDASQYTTTGQIDDYFDALTNLPKDRFSTALFTGKHASGILFSAQHAQLDVGGLLATHSVPTGPKFATTTGGRSIAYLQLRNEDEGSQDELIAAFRQIEAHGGVQDLVLDLRDNLGGFVYSALTAASMITGPANDGKVFERLVFNDKRGQTSLAFSGAVQFKDGSSPQFAVGTALPRLGLQRVFILAGGDTASGAVTCSAAESIINSLRGVGLQVIRLGETTCGKPFGFSEKVNCGYSFYAIEFQGFNAQGFGDYQNGFDPMCRISDQVPFADRGTAVDPVYNGALYYMDHSTPGTAPDAAACPPGSTFTGIQSAARPIVSPARKPPPLAATRRLSPEMLPR